MKSRDQRVLGVDPGDKNIGIAISDSTATIANPFRVIKHVSRLVDAAQVAQFALDLDANLIIVGCPLDEDGKIGPQARKSLRFVEELRRQTNLPVETWDESGSTLLAREARREMGVSRKERRGHLDALAATVILQSYLDSLQEHPI